MHRIGNGGRVPATSIHAYSPPGLDMRTFEDSTDAAWLSLGRQAAVGARR